MSAHIASVQARFEIALIALAPEHPLDLPKDLREIYELLVDLTNDGLEECRLSLEDELKANRKEAA